MGQSVLKSLTILPCRDVLVEERLCTDRGSLYLRTSASVFALNRLASGSSRKQELACIDHVDSASARLSKGQGYQGFLRKRAVSSFGQKGQFASYKEKLEKLEKLTEFHYF
jgi:hypothetical protein